jgi:hypothetical protein
LNAPVKLIWLASYPKSGNTWLRFMLVNLLLGRQSSTENMDKLIPDIHVLTAGGKWPPDLNFYHGFPALMKTHFVLSPRLPLGSLTGGFIYVVRNPLDVIASAVNYELLKAGMPADAVERDAFRKRCVQEFIDHGGTQGWIEGGFGSWEENAGSWVRNGPGIPNVVIRYEDIVRDPVAQLERVSAFLGLRTERQRIQAAVEDSSFEHMRAIEEQEVTSCRQGFFSRETPAASFRRGIRFMSRGRPGAGETEITTEERVQLLTRFGPTMKRIGYPVQV